MTTRDLLRRWLQSSAAGAALLRRSRLHRVQWQSRRKPGGLRWKIVAPCPDPKLDAGGVQIGSRLYVIAGYSAEDRVCPFIDVLDLRRRRWRARIPLADAVGHSHLAFATDGMRIIYIVSGQRGGNCRPAIRHAAALDVMTGTWRALPPLPEARYAATMQLWRGRLHVLGGSREDRYTAAQDHWSLAVADGAATETAWRREIPMPHAVCHHASAVVGDDLYVLGGQRGDFVAVPGSPDYECTGRTQEIYSSAAARLRPGATAWDTLPDLPVAASHTEASVLVLGASIVLIGGQCAKDPMTFNLKLTDAIQVFDTRSRQWRVVGHLPYRVKTAVAGWDRGSVYIVGGQRDAGPSYPGPDAIVSDAWRARLPINV